jgi:hypothetical protein
MLTCKTPVFEAGGVARSAKVAKVIDALNAAAATKKPATFIFFM